MIFSLEADGRVCILLSFLLLTLPLPWIFGLLIAGIFHELCHMAMMGLTGVRILRLQFGLSGAEISTAGMTLWQELLCALAGPAGSFLLLAVLPWYPQLAVFGFLQGCVNLLPLYPLDGGRAVRCFLQLLIPRYAGTVCSFLSASALLTLLALGIYASFLLKLGILPLLLPLWAGYRFLQGNISCKQRLHRVQ